MLGVFSYLFPLCPRISPGVKGRFAPEAARPGKVRFVYCNEGTTTTPFDLTVLNELDRFQLVLSVIDQVPKLAKSVDPVSRGGDPGETR
jgi:hypothetical protein